MCIIYVYQLIGKDMRGAVNYMTQKHSKSNNKYMKFYDKDKPSVYIIYHDSDNSYAWSMIQYLQEDFSD